jgi:hypothetical protein
MANDKRGRPPKPEGERVDDYPKISIPIRPQVRALLDALVSVFERTAYKVIEEALLAFRATQTPRVQAHIDAKIKGAGGTTKGIDYIPINVPKRYHAAVNAFLELLENPRGDIQINSREYFLKFLRVTVAEESEQKKEGNGKE